MKFLRIIALSCIAATFTTDARKLNQDEENTNDQPASAPVTAIEELGYANWNDKVLSDSDNVWIVNFDDLSGCWHSKDFKPEFDEVVEDSRMQEKNIRFGHVDLKTEAYRTYLEGVRQTPTVLVYGLDKSQAPVQYTGENEVDELLNFIMEYCDSHNGCI